MKNPDNTFCPGRRQPIVGERYGLSSTFTRWKREYPHWNESAAQGGYRCWLCRDSLSGSYRVSPSMDDCGDSYSLAVEVSLVSLPPSVLSEIACFRQLIEQRIVWHTRSRETSQVHRAKEWPLRQRSGLDRLCHPIENWSNAVLRWPSFDEAERAAARRIRRQLR